MADQYQLPPREPNEPNEPTVPIDNVPPPSPSGGQQRDRRWLPLLLIGGGVLLFLGNSGVFASIAWSVLLPLAMLAVGLDLITEGRSRRRIAIGALIAAPLLVLLVGGANMLRGSRSDSQPAGHDGDYNRLEGIERLRVDIKQSGNLKIRALDEDSSEAFALDDEVEHEYRRDGNTGVLVLRPSGWDGANTELSISPDLPLDMTVELSAGNAEPLDLSATRLENLAVRVRAGNTEVKLPATGVKDVMVDNTAGNIEIMVPEELAARVEASASLGNVVVDDDRFTRRDGVWYSSSYSEDSDNQATIKLSSRAGNIEVE